MRIVTLIENLVYKQGLGAEHGLSFYMETHGRKILFDTGQTGQFMKNAQTLGIDITDIDTVIISHGHYDHTGGLYPFLLANSRAKVYIKEEAFLRKYNGPKRFIGVPFDQAMLEHRIEYVKEITQVAPQLFIMPGIAIRHPQDTNFGNFKISYPGGFANDEFDDELYLCHTDGQAMSIITSCSHRGISNIIDGAVAHFKLPVDLILGGFHIKECGPEQFEVIMTCLERHHPRRIGACHCTGVEKFADMKQRLGKGVFYNFTGHEITL
ncbi:7,8-dihydropterin-6-yl-methyl-4-(beta-D-ribofuranosyl)aminobenzene 5'-phosphate synthase [Breznakibacter xylanolyticus]|uniref:7, 8-dihydropterin-6-yl-methyl-4-(Beta-D-ribofuranosyl)aminobenzene 5'-phosphate synthase n=1 Tax=Breznakibacter xylanolyticus TaxID=990 RepID=A0A2W7NHV9_9BACT|nr:MBL fold metallo-hydrolase [Breznakibacter xylanolyticus]PZX20015.1 7,8-dihydropterin-6-yl-methyl-4-(beta-D-ribofuranosyl)aminobenzene 5'-phosphate synthase [Breznakibacter xylanolyticus]